MVKIIASISFLFYLAVTSGVVINSHYCMKRLASVHLFETQAKVCGICGMETHQSTGCCRDKVKVVKLVLDQDKQEVALYDIAALKIISVTPSEFIIASFENNYLQRHYHNHSPPLLSAQDTYLQNSVFRI